MLSDTFQIESLWQFNRKYDPGWIRRYATYSAIEDYPSCLLAVAKAESYWELPLIGRFMLPSAEAPWADLTQDAVYPTPDAVDLTQDAVDPTPGAVDLTQDAVHEPLTAGQA